jgi:hypothetical protein
MDFIERKAVKLLARSQNLLADMTGEALCNEPQKPLIRAMLKELREMLDEFDDAYFDEAAKPG